MGVVLSDLILAYIFAIVLVMVFSWMPQMPGTPGHRVYLFLRRLTDPVLLPIRRLVPPLGGVVDISPMIVILGLGILRSLLVR